MVEVHAQNAHEKPYFSLSYSKTNEGTTDASFDDFLQDQKLNQANYIEGS